MQSPILIPTMVCARCNTPCTIISPGFSLCELCSGILDLKHKAKEEKRLKKKLNGWIDASKQTPALIEGEDYSENVIKEGDYVITEDFILLKVKSIEERPNGNCRYNFTNGRFGLKDESSLGLPNSRYTKVDVSRCNFENIKQNDSKSKI